MLCPPRVVFGVAGMQGLKFALKGVDVFVLKFPRRLRLNADLISSVVGQFVQLDDDVQDITDGGGGIVEFLQAGLVVRGIGRGIGRELLLKHIRVTVDMAPPKVHLHAIELLDPHVV